MECAFNEANAIGFILSKLRDDLLDILSNEGEVTEDAAFGLIDKYIMEFREIEYMKFEEIISSLDIT